jgi:hypothetical protein
VAAADAGSAAITKATDAADIARPIRRPVEVSRLDAFPAVRNEGAEGLMVISAPRHGRSP